MPNIEGILADIKIIGQIPSEIRDFMAWLSERNIKDVLEIGVADGGSISCWKGLFPSANVLGLDVGTGSDLLSEMWRKYGFALIMNSDSHKLETLERVKTFAQAEDKKFDLIFVDGDHTYEGVKKDYEMYWPLVRNEGIMAFHDIKDTEHHRSNNVYVGQFWGELKGSCTHALKEFINPNEGWGGIGCIFK